MDAGGIDHPLAPRGRSRSRPAWPPWRRPDARRSDRRGSRRIEFCRGPRLANLLVHEQRDLLAVRQVLVRSLSPWHSRHLSFGINSRRLAAGAAGFARRRPAPRRGQARQPGNWPSNGEAMAEWGAHGSGFRAKSASGMHASRGSGVETARRLEGAWNLPCGNSDKSRNIRIAEKRD